MTPSAALNLVSLFAAAAARDGAKAALVFEEPGGSEVWSYSRLRTAALRTARVLRSRGVGRGDRIGCLLGSSPEFVVVYLAILACGAAMVPINLAYRRREIAHILGDAEPRLLIAGRDQLATIAELDAAERASVEDVLIAEEIVRCGECDPDRPGESAGGFAAELLAPQVELDRDDLALLVYTSGTTGRSKGAMLSHGNVLAMNAALHEAWRWEATDALLLSLPLFHVHGLINGLHCALAAGATLLLEPRFDAAHTVDRLARGDATLFFGVPTLYVRLVDELRRRNAVPAFPRVRLFVSGSAPLAAETHVAFEELTGQRILERYGMTETGMLLGNPLDGVRRAGTVGRPMPGVELRLVDGEGRAVADGKEGEIEVRGANVFSGYWRAPEATAASFRADAGGVPWFRTGDLGRVDPADGYVILLGRASELILSGGFNVYPREVEEVLSLFPGVREAAVVGEPSPEFGESPIAYLVGDRPIDLPALDAFCNRQLARFKMPRRYVQIDALPRNALGKVEKRRLLSP